jgi:Family of unknown function (DUF5995)
MDAHVNNDLAFVIEELGPRYTYPDHKHVDDVLAFRTRPVVYPEIQHELCPGLFSEVVPPGADADIFTWRQLAWDNAQRLLAAPTAKERERIAREIRQHAKDKAHEILHWYRCALLGGWGSVSSCPSPRGVDALRLLLGGRAPAGSGPRHTRIVWLPRDHPWRRRRRQG